MRESRAEPAPSGRGRGRRVSPGGVVAAGLVLVLAAVCVRLGIWQLDRLEERRARNEALRGALALPPLELDAGAVARVRDDPERFLFRRVRVSGVYLPEGEVVLRGRSLEGSPGVHLLTPLRIGGGPWAVLVNRGWAPASDALSVDPRPLAEPGGREVEGLIQPFPPDVRESRPLETEVDGARVTSVQRMDTVFLRERVAAPLLPIYVQQLPGPGDSGAVRRLPVPPLDEGPHLGYAVQWFSFAAIALGGLLVLLLRARRERA